MEQWLLALSWLNVAVTAALAVSSIFVTLQFWRRRGEQFIAKRRPSGTMACCLSSILFFVLNRLPLALWSQLGAAAMPSFYHFGVELSYLVFGVGAIYCILHRALVIWYSTNCQTAAKDKDWRLLIDESEENWFLSAATKSRFGDFAQTARVLALCVFLGAVPTMSYLAMKTWHWRETEEGDLNYLGLRVQSGALSLFPALCIGCVWWKTPILDDNFWILGELRLVLRVAFAVVLAQCAIVVLGDPAPGTALYLLFLFLTTFCAAAAVHIMTLGVVLKSTAFAATSTRSRGDDQRNRIVPDAANHSAGDLDLKTVLETERGFQLFMRWLTMEWSSENLLFILETAQFAKHCSASSKAPSPPKQRRSDSKKYRLSRKGTGPLDFVPPQSCPRSAIVFADDEDLHEKALALHSKYIARDAVLWVNISGAASQRIAERIAAIRWAVGMRTACGSEPAAQREDDDLPGLFQEAQGQIWELMEGSFIRFKLTEQFGAFAAALHQRREKSLGQRLGHDLDSLSRKVSFLGNAHSDHDSGSDS